MLQGLKEMVFIGLVSDLSSAEMILIALKIVLFLALNAISLFIFGFVLDILECNSCVGAFTLLSVISFGQKLNK